MKTTVLASLVWLTLLLTALPLHADPNRADPQPTMDTTDHSGGWVGKTAASFTLTDSDGKKVDLSTVFGTKPVVLIFYRGKWCPFCRGQMADLAAHKAELVKSGAAMYAISNETAPDLNAMRDHQNVGFITFLSDPEGVAARLYAGLYPDSPVHQPGTFVVDKAGKIVYAYVNEDYKSRAATLSLLAAISKAQAAP